MESSHSRNVGIGKLANKYWYSTKNPAQLKDPNIRNAVEGFPMLLYINDEFMGVYNFNTDRYSNATFGYTDAENCLVYEVSANSDTTAGAFHSWSEASGVAELDYYKSDFLSIYPPTRRAGNDDFAEMKELVTFVDTSSDEVFIESINNNLYFNKEYLLRYLIYALLMGAVDSLGKNMKLATWDKGKTWYPQLYDCDTTMGLDNTGFLAYTNSNIKIEQGTYNTSNSRLWQRVLELFWTEIQVEYAKMRNTYLTLDHIYECIIEEQMDKIPATYYNQDMQTKYLQFGSSYLYALHGQGKQQVMTWLRERLLYVDTYLEYWSSTSDYVTIRASKLGEIYLDLETYDNMFLQVKWRNTGNADDVNAIQIKEMHKGEVTRFTFNSLVATDQEIRIYGGKYLKSVGALDNLAPTKVFITNAPRLTEIVCHSANLQTIDLSTCTNLQHIDLKDCVKLGVGDQSTKTIEVSQCMNLKYVNCQNTQILGINLGTKGTNVKEIWYPTTITSISLSNCPNLKIIGLEVGHNCTELKVINCPKVEAFGDREYNSATETYKYKNSKWLSGLHNLYLDNSCLSLTEWEMLECVGLKSITIKNMPNMTKLLLGINKKIEYKDLYTSETTWNDLLLLEDLKNEEDIKISLINTGIKTFYITAPFRQSYYHEESTILSKPYHCFRANVLDISDTQIENLYILSTADIYKLKLPNTLKKYIVDSYFDIDTTIKNSEGKVFDKSTFILNKFSPNKGSNNLTYKVFKCYKGEQLNVIECSLGGLYTYQTPTANQGSTIWKVWCPSNVEEPSDIVDSENNVLAYAWDFKDLNLEDFWIWDLNAKYMHHNMKNYNTDKAYPSDSYVKCYMKNDLYRIQIRNLVYTPKKYQLSLSGKYIYERDALQNCSIDYSQFKGNYLDYAFAYFNDNGNTYIPPTDYSQIISGNLAIFHTVTQQFGWEVAEKIFPLINDLNDFICGFSDCILKEQQNENEAISIINSKVEVQGAYSYYNSWFNNCNIKYIKEITLVSVSIGYIFSGNKSLISVGDITLGSDNLNSTYFAGTFSAFSDCTNLVSVGNITINLNGLNTDYDSTGTFRNCTNLQTVGKISFIGTNNMTKTISLPECFVNCSSLSSVNLDTPLVSNYLGCFRGCRGMVSLSLDLQKATSIQSVCEGCTNLETITIHNIDSSTLTSVYQAFLGCANLTSIIIDEGVKRTWGNNISNAESCFQGCTNLGEDMIIQINDENTCVVSCAKYLAGCLKVEGNEYSLPKMVSKAYSYFQETNIGKNGEPVTIHISSNNIEDIGSIFKQTPAVSVILDFSEVTQFNKSLKISGVCDFTSSFTSVLQSVEFKGIENKGLKVGTNGGVALSSNDNNLKRIRNVINFPISLDGDYTSTNAWYAFMYLGGNSIESSEALNITFQGTLLNSLYILCSYTDIKHRKALLKCLGKVTNKTLTLSNARYTGTKDDEYTNLLEEASNKGWTLVNF